MTVLAGYAQLKNLRRLKSQRYLRGQVVNLHWCLASLGEALPLVCCWRPLSARRTPPLVNSKFKCICGVGAPGPGRLRSSSFHIPCPWLGLVFPLSFCVAAHPAAPRSVTACVGTGKSPPSGLHVSASADYFFNLAGDKIQNSVSKFSTPTVGPLWFLYLH